MVALDAVASAELAASVGLADAAKPACAPSPADATDFDPIAYINTPRWQASRLGLERISELLERMGRPQDSLRFVHVAGTNGKGSTCSFLASVLEEAGYKTGLFTSPYIEAFEERIRVNGANISREDLTRATLAVRAHASAMERDAGEHPTEFELMTAVALEHFRNEGCDIVVMEVGLGGRLDSTNVIDAPEVCVIARIGLDHTALLGDTVAQVAAEKTGIVKPGVPVVSWPQEPAAAGVVTRVAAQGGCALTAPDFSRLSLGNVSLERGVREFSYNGARYETQLLGRYQPFNAALAIEAVEALRRRGWAISPDALARGIASATWPGRFEVAARAPLVIVDGGHNPQGALALVDSLVDILEGGNEAGEVAEGAARVFTPASARAAADAAATSAATLSVPGPAGTVDFVMGVLADKDYRPMIEAVLPLAASFSVYTPDNPRALSAQDLAKEVASCGASVPVASFESPAVALSHAKSRAGERGVVVAFGTLYAIGEIKVALRS